MHKFYIYLKFLLLGTLLVAQDEATELADWELVWEEQFDSRKLDSDKWTPLDPWGLVRNEELQGYLPSQVKLEGGECIISCEKKPCFYDGAKREYRSGMISTHGKFAQTYGRFEIRCKSPKGVGFWPAFWMLPDPPAWPPEIDIMEILCEKPDEVFMTNHWTHPTDSEETDSNSADFQG
ncbi:MAG: glycoside hydrolase family 16 protein, partial [Verrucomicrobiota bacterium]